MSKSALGRGLGALLGGAPATLPAATATPAAVAPAVASAPAGEPRRHVAVGRIRPCTFQPRKDFTEAAIQELAASIREQGILQPLIVRERDGGYELIAGERRWRAAQAAGLGEVPVIVREADDRTVLELALVENLQRENLNALEEAEGYARLIEQFSLTQEQAAAKVGRGRVSVANALRLLKLPREVQAYVRDGHLSAGHAKAILGLPTAAEQNLAAERVLREGLNVRQTEELVAGWAGGPAAGSRSGRKNAAAQRDVHVANLETKLQERLGAKVSLRYRKGKGRVEIRFFNDEDLERILQIIGVRPD
jgi:ParB family transcriptional regulator, chromosome partitioning protein